MPKSKRRDPDHAPKHQYPGLDNEVIAADLEPLLTPALYAQQAYIRQLDLRNRILNLSLMLAAMLTLLWRGVPSVQELTRMFVVADLCCRRWRTEEAFSTMKRLLSLSYLWTGSLNGIQLQIWATWLFYAVLVDLGNAVANEVGVPFEQFTCEMLTRRLYHFSVAYNKEKTADPVSYFAAPQNQNSRVVKIPKKESPLDLSPFPRRSLPPKMVLRRNMVVKAECCST